MLAERLKLPDTEPVGSEETDREAVIVLLVATALLLVFAYWGRPSFYASSGLIDWVSRNVGGPFTDHPGLGGYVWWGITSLTLRLLLPLGVIVWALRRRPVEFGFRLRGVGRHLGPYALFYLAMLPLLVWASSLDSFQGYYPFYDRAGEGGGAFWLFEASYVVQFIGLEAFFRGFITFGLLRRFGMLAIPIMTIPYTMIHFGKPMPEATAAIAAGLLLGYMAVRTRSWVPGAVLHMGVAVTMDVLVLWRGGLLSNVF